MSGKNERIPLRLDRFWHGGDYNPEQWEKYPEVLAEDITLMGEAGVNVVALGIFSWAALEPEEGVFRFEWLDETMGRLARAGIDVILATPSGARPAWLARRYPEVLRVGADGIRNRWGERHNHCYTAPAYREKVGIINRRLASRYAGHPALKLWHVSNEYGGECHCDLCQAAFRTWLKTRYRTLEDLNDAWWTRFWSHTYQDWEQIESPSARGMGSLHGLNLDWKRFVTDQTVDFMRAEIVPLRECTPEVPVTTNLMGSYPGLNYWHLAPHLDVVSWDSYPRWHGPEGDVAIAAGVAFHHDLARSLGGGTPFLMMESTPSVTNWQEVGKQKRPGLHRLSSLQAVAHGSDSVQYFQWRKSRGGPEKFHGAVVDHGGANTTRVFHDVKDVGEVLSRLRPAVGSRIRAEAAVVFDWENRWAIEDAKGPRRKNDDYLPTVMAHHRALWAQGIATDVIAMDEDFAGYRLVAAPMLYLVRPGVAERLRAFVERGGTLVLTALSGVVDEHDLVFRGGAPGPLGEIAGIRVEEVDAIFPGETRPIRVVAEGPLPPDGSYAAARLIEVVHPTSGEVLAVLAADYYAGSPALTVNRAGAGLVYYLATPGEALLLADFYRAVAERVGLARPLLAPLPDGVSATVRRDDGHTYLFVLNFNDEAETVALDRDAIYRDLLASGRECARSVTLAPYGVFVAEVERG